MIRFRCSEDEARYQRLVAEAYRILATQLSSPSVSHVMRNFAKLEQLSYLEGIRQGLAVAEISIQGADRGQPHARNLKAFQAHAMVYGSTDTPLRQVEEEWLRQIGTQETVSRDAWLDDKPMRFAPQTLQESIGELPQAHPPPHFSRLEDLDPRLAAPFRTAPASPPEATTLQTAYDDGAPLQLVPDDQVEEPASLDRIREVLLSTGEKPSTWTDLILLLHRSTGFDAGFLDIQLNTHMGRTALAQCGIHLDPGPGLDLSSLPVADPPDTEDHGGGATDEDGSEPGPGTV